ncbi:transposon Tf2-6 polyprotein [Trichonephila clavipes]|nr:transposon Tf2-6 polyprotein [Trichonephila clavipes]
MEQQIADLLRQNQDLIRALQIREDSHSHKVTVQFDKFDEENENFDSFIERFETYLDVQNVPIANRAKVFVSSLSAKLYQLLKNLLAPDIPSDQTLDKLKDALKKHLTPKPLIIPSRHKFLNRKQTEGEGISTYIAELRALAMNCDYDKDMLNIMLRDVFVSGLRDKMILDRLFEEDNISLEKTLNIALAMEKAFKGTNDIMGRAINSMQTFKKHMDKKSNFTKSRKKTLYCSRCTGTNHAKKRIIDLFQVNVISVGKLGTLNRHASHLKRQMRNRLNKNRVRTVPFALKGRVENEIDRLEKEGIIEKVDSSEWATPVVPVVKSDASDASPVGIGCVLSHVYPDGSERPIAFASRTLSGSEKKYSQIDKEALSIVWAVRKFYLYLKGRRFTLITDHKPLIAIFGSKRGLPVLAATRLLHYALILQSFEFDIIFRKTIEHGNADFLSRLPKTSEELEVKDDITIFQMSQIEALPVTSKELRQETSKDIELGPLLRALREGKDLQGREAQCTIEDGCIMYGQRVCIPRKFRKNVLEELHAGHLGIVKMKAIARSFVYWKNIDNDIEEAAENCVDCARYIRLILSPKNLKFITGNIPVCPGNVFM